MATSAKRTVNITPEQVDAANVRIRVDRRVGRSTDPRIVAISKVERDSPVVYKGVEMDLVAPARVIEHGDLQHGL